MHTPGPWIWRINRKTKHVDLVARAGWGLTVMDFVRYGMNSAAPRFLDENHLMVRADELAKNIPGEEHHAEWNQDIDHPDARLIAAAPELLEALKTLYAEEHRDDDDPILNEARNRARAAIAKAEGRDNE